MLPINFLQNCFKTAVAVSFFAAITNDVEFTIATAMAEFLCFNCGSGRYCCSYQVNSVSPTVIFTF